MVILGKLRFFIHGNNCSLSNNSFIFLLTFDSGSVPLLSVTIRASVSHGTYIRSVSHELGKFLGVGATVIDLNRTEVGGFKNSDSFQVLSDGKLFGKEKDK